MDRRLPRRGVPPYAFTEHMFNHPPQTMIRLIVEFAQRPRASRRYRYLMTTVDAIVFSRPDYGELRHLATTITDQHTRGQA